MVVVGCAKDNISTASTPTRYVPIFYLASETGGLDEALAARLAAAGIASRVMPVREVPADEIPSWADGSKGWIALVPAHQRVKAEVVKDEWLESITVSTEAEPPASRPALELGEETPVAPATLAAIKAELARRYRVDQAVRRDPDRHAEMKQVDADNTAWLERTVVAHGWIDAARFGSEAANAAFMLVQHSGDLPLMNAALPKIERDVKARRLNAQTFALLYDRLQLMQGGRQRYGTQVMKDTRRGDWAVKRLEDPDRVDELRKELGLEPLRENLARFGDVRIER